LLSIDLQNKDCFDFLSTIKDNSVDLILTDPPYYISRDSGFTYTKVEKYAKHTIDFGEWDNGEQLDYQKIVNECYRVLKKSGTLIMFYDLWKITELKQCIENAKFVQLRFIEWIKTNPVPINSKLNYLTNSREIALTCVKGGKPTFNSEYDNGIYSHSICQDAGRFHPTQKPIKLIEELIKKHSNENNLVLDCFAGSGTTAVACQNLKRAFIGCEINKEYFDKAIMRIKDNQKGFNF